MSKLKKGVYMGPTAELFLLTTPQEATDLYASKSDTHILVTLEEKIGGQATNMWSLPGQEVEFQRLLAGFTYLGRL
jgi:hypothetical protein